MNDVIPFDFDGQAVRVLLDEDGSEWFVSKDVCASLGVVWKGSDSTGPLGHLDKDEKGMRSFITPGGLQEMSVINESGVYHMIFRNRKPKTARFRKWVTAEVLPTLRRTGRYTIADEEDEEEEPKQDLPENGRAQRIVDAGRVFNSVSRILRTAETLPPERLELALSVTGEIAGVDLKGLMERGGSRVPLLEALPPDEEAVVMADLLGAWHEALGSRRLAAGELLEEIRAMVSDEGDGWRPLHPALAEAAERAMGPPDTWGARELGYRLRAWSRRHVGGLRLLSEGKSRKGIRWRVRVIRDRCDSTSQCSAVNYFQGRKAGPPLQGCIGDTKSGK